MTIENVSSHKAFGGWNKQYTHHSNTLNCAMRFSIYIPPQASSTHAVPVLYWLSGLTCSDENFIHKAGAQRIAAELGIAIVVPDTSPRGDGVADDNAYDLGQGAGFYLNATQLPWSEHFQMYDYIQQELPALIEANFPVNHHRAISGHSMGGHGALTIGLRNPERYQSISAFSPICHPVDCPWGEKAFTAYLGSDKSTWENYDASILMNNISAKDAELPMNIKEMPPIRIDQGLDDEFLSPQLKLRSLQEAASESDYPIIVRQHSGYDHSYFFISSFIGEHLAFHAKHLLKS
jgi:S-formylglutathione hydrolase